MLTETFLKSPFSVEDLTGKMSRITGDFLYEKSPL
jgi:hypothetical protein